MHTITIELESFNCTLDDCIDDHAGIIAALTTALAIANSNYLYRNIVPRLYSTNIKYHFDIKDRDKYFDIPRVIRNGYGDCVDLTAWRLAELWNNGMLAAKPKVTWAKNSEGNIIFHVSVDGGDDPSTVMLAKNGSR